MRQFIPGFTDILGRIITGFGGIGFGLINEGAGAPQNGVAGYQTGALWSRRDGAAATAIYINVGTELVSSWTALNVGQTAVSVAGVAAGYKLARGQATTVTASDTVVTGLATVVSVTTSLDSDPVVGASFASASIGNQAGAPAAGSILVKTWKPTTAGAAGNPDVIAATTFGKLVNWIAVGT